VTSTVAQVGAALDADAVGEPPVTLLVLDADLPPGDGFAVLDQLAHLGRSPEVILVALPMGEPSSLAARYRERGVAGCVRKPIREGDLRDAVLGALGLASPDGEAAAGPAGGARDAADGPRRGRMRPLRVLLAEDNPVNQRLTVRLLEREGHAVVLVENGREAVAAVQRESFDLALMDLHMPEMGGLEATAAIRVYEEGAGGRLPILALTADVIHGVRERCLEGGMDGYMEKPIKADGLFTAILGAVPEAASSSQTPGPDEAERSTSLPAAVDLPVLEWSELLACVGGDQSLAGELIELFGQCLPEMQARICEAAKRRDWSELVAAVHRLRGSLANISALEAAAVAHCLEAAALEPEEAAIAALQSDLAAALERLQAALAAEPGSQAA